MVDRQIEKFERLAAQQAPATTDEIDGFRTRNGILEEHIKDIVNGLTIKRPARRQKCYSTSGYMEKASEINSTLPRSKKPSVKKRNSIDYRRVVSQNSIDYTNDEEIGKKVEEFADKLKQKRELRKSYGEESSKSNNTSSTIDVHASRKLTKSVSLKEDNCCLPSATLETLEENLPQSEDDIFGLNEFDGDSNNNFIVEAYNNESKDLIITYYQISHKVINENTKDDEIREMSKNSDVTIRRDFPQASAILSESATETQADPVSGETMLEQSSSSAKQESLLHSEQTVDDSRQSVKCSIGFGTEEDDEQTLSDNYYSYTYDFSTTSAEVLSFSNSLYDDHGNVRVQTIIKGPRPVKSVELETPPTLPPKERISKLRYIIEELIKTEEQYVSGLDKVVNKYQTFINQSYPKHIIGKQSYLFGNIREIFKQAQKFLGELKNTPRNPVAIAKLFLNWEAMFELYPQYSKNKPTADLYLKDFDDIIKKRQKALKDKLDLASYLLTPIQRLGKYVLILENMQKEMMKNTAGNSEESSKISMTAAIDMIKRVMRKGNDSIAIDSIKNCKVDLTLQGSFIMREKFSITKHKKKYESMVFLFEKIIVFTLHSPKNMEEFNYIGSIQMNDLSIACYEEEELMFKLIDFPKTKRGNPEEFTYILYARTDKIKVMWTNAITAKLWDQLTKAKIQQKQLHDDQGKRYSSMTLPNLRQHHRSGEDGQRKSTFYIGKGAES